MHIYDIWCGVVLLLPSEGGMQVFVLVTAEIKFPLNWQFIVFYLSHCWILYVNGVAPNILRPFIMCCDGRLCPDGGV